MSVTLSDIKCVQMQGMKTVAKFPMDEQVVCSDGSVFIRLNPRNTSLVALVVEDNDAPGIPRPVPKNFSLTASDGIKLLRRMRNAAQAESLIEERPQATCTLFASSPEAQEKKRQRVMTRSEMAEKRKEHVPIVISLDGIHVRVLRPVQQDDVIHVEYEEESLAAVISCIRREGFNEENRRTRDPTMPKGIQRRDENRYQVAYKDSAGRLKRTMKRTLHEALEAQAVLLAAGNETCAEDEAGDDDCDGDEE